MAEDKLVEVDLDKLIEKLLNGIEGLFCDIWLITT
jgi:hypothetical protein